MEIMQNKKIIKHIECSYLWTTVPGRGYVDVGHLNTISENSRPEFTFVQSTLGQNTSKFHLHMNTPPWVMSKNSSY